MSALQARLSLQQSKYAFIMSLQKEVQAETHQSFNIHVAKAKLLMLKTNWEKFEAEHEKIILSKVEIPSDDPYMKNNAYETAMQCVVSIQAALEERISELETANPPCGTSLANVSLIGGTAVRPSSLPKIPIPPFSGNFGDWRAFSDLFVSLIGENTAISNAEKFAHLRNSLSRNAASLISNIKISADSFQVAWDMLVRRYENKRLLIAAQLDKLLRLKTPGVRSSATLNDLLNVVSESTNSLKALGLPVD
ncbi:uncharacterized protein LOC141537912 [Cotesia typhae]|uniref:uncharacterized protein LOC141537912 n=1 Tax=Cotesia typhae TaxID=2053667 RepID=UPI003D69168B